MSAIGFGDELVRDYLVFRGFLNALKVFEAEVKADKDRGFRPDRIVEHLSSCIINLDLVSLRESWTHLDRRFFSRLEHSSLGTAKKLEIALLRMYLITCISSGRQDKLVDFFEKMTPELQGQPEWKEWFALPFMKNADEHPTFAAFFSRQWQDMMMLSLHNFISVTFHSAAMPVLLDYHEDLVRMEHLMEENDMLKKKLSALQRGEAGDVLVSSHEKENYDFMTQRVLMDDFFVIAQESTTESTGRSIKSLIRNISSGGAPTSPVSTRRTADVHKEDVSLSTKSIRIKPRSPSVPPRPSTQLSVHESSPSPKESPELTKSTSQDECPSSPRRLKSHTKLKSLSSSSKSSPRPLDDGKSGFIILSCEKYSEHNSLITHCKFNCSGTSVASSDMDGVIKIWSASPSISTQSTIMSKTSVLSLEWDRKRDRLLFYGGQTVRLFDTKERKVLKEMLTDSNSENQRILCICCNPLGTSLVTSSCIGDEGHLMLWDMKTLSLDKSLSLSSNKSCACCCSFNHNGQLLLVGSSNGYSSILDLRTSEKIASWESHKGGVFSTEFSTDETTCYTTGGDGKFYSWSVHKTGHRQSELDVYPKKSYHEDQTVCSYGKLFSLNSDGTHLLTCGPLGGIIYEITHSTANPVLDIGGHSKPVNTVDWSTAMESSTCICGTVDGKVIVSTLLNQ